VKHHDSSLDVLGEQVHIGCNSVIFFSAYELLLVLNIYLKLQNSTYVSTSPLRIIF